MAGNPERILLVQSWEETVSGEEAQTPCWHLMSGPYLQHQSWPAFVYQDQRYRFDHLNEYIFGVSDSQAIMRQIAVTFTDHCFTREREAGDDEAHGVSIDCRDGHARRMT